MLDPRKRKTVAILVAVAMLLIVIGVVVISTMMSCQARDLSERQRQEMCKTMQVPYQGFDRGVAWWFEEVGPVAIYEIITVDKDGYRKETKMVAPKQKFHYVCGVAGTVVNAVAWDGVKQDYVMNWFPRATPTGKAWTDTFIGAKVKE